MIVYKPKRIMGRLLLKRFVKMRDSDKLKRIHQEMCKLRKLWWHYQTRWEIK